LNDRNTGELLNIYRECDNKQDGIFYEALQRPFDVPQMEQRGSSRGISIVALSPDGRFCTTKS